MKYAILMISILFSFTLTPATTMAQRGETGSLFSEKTAKSGCCKERASAQHPWQRNNKNYQQCEAANKSDQDNVSRSQGKVWWDRSC
ncbi:MAG: hypothetical protein KAI17_00290 [Thiotrichaceae bacterium]|nr:hypothetical protein [Thiotrichaceae bacterium]